MLASAIEPSRGRYVPVDFRAVILEKMRKLSITPNGLYETLKKDGAEIGRTTVYSFLEGKSDMLSASVARILEVLEKEEKRRK